MLPCMLREREKVFADLTKGPEMGRIFPSYLGRSQTQSHLSLQERGTETLGDMCTQQRRQCGHGGKGYDHEATREEIPAATGNQMRQESGSAAPPW